MSGEALLALAAVKPHGYLRYPEGAPDFSDPEAFIEWIEQVRNVAFLSGARHGEITRSEVALLLPHIAALVEHVEALGGGCDANGGGEHDVMQDGKTSFCPKCGLMLKRVAYVLPHVKPSAVRAAIAKIGATP